MGGGYGVKLTIAGVPRTVVGATGAVLRETGAVLGVTDTKDAAKDTIKGTIDEFVDAASTGTVVLVEVDVIFWRSRMPLRLEARVRRKNSSQPAL